MIKSKAFKYLLWKSYFDTGLGLTSYVKYLIAFFGVSTLNMRATLYIGLIYFLVCLLLGKLWYHYKLVEVQAEIGNLFNPFQREVRAKLRKR